MRILIDIGHPAHVHYFHNLIIMLRERHIVNVTCRDTKIVKKLLKHYEIAFEVIGSKKDGFVSKIGSQFVIAQRIRSKICLNRIDIAMGVSGAAVHGAMNTKAKSILFDDDDQCVQPLMSRFVTPFADTILSPDTLSHEMIRKAIYYPGYHEYAYLHPNRFTANPHVLAKYGLNVEDKFFILRFNAFKAHHDVNEGGMNILQKRKLVALLKNYGRVFITTEADLEKEFEEYKIPIDPEDMHHFLAFAQMLVSDSQTMTSEAAVLGTPSFRCNTFVGRISYLEEEEKKYGLTKGFLPREFDWMMGAIEYHLMNKDAKLELKFRQLRMLRDKIDVTAFWLWFIDNYPDSKNIVNNPKFDYNQFKSRY